MRSRISSIFVSIYLAALVTGTCQAQPQAWYDIERLTDLTFGVFCDHSKDPSVEADGTIKGTIKALADNPALMKKTQTVPAIDGLLFGFMAREQPNSTDEVTITVAHPPLGQAGNQSESWGTQMRGDRQTFHGYYLGLSNGNPIGRWTITATRSGHQLVRVEFDVVLPSSVPDTVDCRALSS